MQNADLYKHMLVAMTYFLTSHGETGVYAVENSGRNMGNRVGKSFHTMQDWYK
jgi:hypothetical protein